jgi:hypothetical protein
VPVENPMLDFRSWDKEMAMLKTWLAVTRALGVLAVAFGVLGFGVTYSWASRFVPEYQSALLLCGLLTISGIALLAGSRVVRKESPASLISVAASAAVVVVLFAATSQGVILRLWFTLVVHFS